MQDTRATRLGKNPPRPLLAFFPTEAGIWPTLALVEMNEIVERSLVCFNSVLRGACWKPRYPVGQTHILASDRSAAETGSVGLPIDSYVNGIECTAVPLLQLPAPGRFRVV